jgi:hypothetical protein
MFPSLSVFHAPTHPPTHMHRHALNKRDLSCVLCINTITPTTYQSCRYFNQCQLLNILLWQLHVPNIVAPRKGISHHQLNELGHIHIIKAHKHAGNPPKYTKISVFACNQGFYAPSIPAIYTPKVICISIYCLISISTRFI